MVYQQNKPVPVPYLLIRHTKGQKNKEGFMVFSVLCSSPPETAERAQQHGF